MSCLYRPMGRKNAIWGMFIPELIILLPTKNEQEGVGEVIDRIPLEEIAKLGFNASVVIADGKVPI